MPKKKIWANFQRIIELFTQRIVTKLGKNLFQILDSGSRGQKGTGSRIRIRSTECTCCLYGAGRNDNLLGPNHLAALPPY